MYVLYSVFFYESFFYESFSTSTSTTQYACAGICMFVQVFVANQVELVNLCAASVSCSYAPRQSALHLAVNA